MDSPTEITAGERTETIIDINNSRSALDEKGLPEDDPKRQQPEYFSRSGWTRIGASEIAY